MTTVPTLVAGLVGATSKSSSSGSSSAIFYLFILIAVGFYFLVLRPQQRKAKAVREQQNTFEVGDEVLTAGGIVGSVIDIDGDRVTLETSVGASFVVLRQYVLRRLEAPTTEAGTEVDSEHEGENDGSEDAAADQETGDDADVQGGTATDADSSQLDGKGGGSRSRSGRRARRGRNSGNRDDAGGDGPPNG